MLGIPGVPAGAGEGPVRWDLGAGEGPDRARSAGVCAPGCPEFINRAMSETLSHE